MGKMVWQCLVIVFLVSVPIVSWFITFPSSCYQMFLPISLRLVELILALLFVKDLFLVRI